MGQDEELTRFEGRDGAEAEEFIRAINIRAFMTGNLKDDAWVAMLACTAFTGPALRWYRSLSSSTRDSWEALQDAILLHYNSINILEPASPLGDGSGRSRPSLMQPCTGIIRIQSQNQAYNMSYLSVDLSVWGAYTWTRDVPQAIKVRYTPGVQSLEVMDGAGDRVYLGAQFWDDTSRYTNLGKGGRGYLELTPIKATSCGLVSSAHHLDGRPARGETKTDLWNVRTDGSILPILSQNGVDYCLKPCIFKKSKGLCLVSDVAEFSSAWPINTFDIIGNLVLEPLYK